LSTKAELQRLAQQTKKDALEKRVESGDLALSPDSAWTEWTSSGRKVYWRNHPFDKATEMPAEGVKVSTEMSSNDFQHYFTRWFGEL
jgi:predicted phosphoadenosine phosphosulfate sulfurtransferase